MRKAVTSKTLDGIGDLTLTATVKDGFVDAFEAVTYETRLKLTLEALFKMRATAREFYRVKPFVDAAERIQSLLDFRITLLEGEPRRVLLTVTFDRPFEPYMRMVWRPLGPLLDLVFCHCTDYVIAAENGFDAYLDWVRSHLVDTDFFYAADELSVADHRYLTAIERLHRDGASDRGLAAAATTVREVLDVAEDVRADRPAETREIALEALVSLYRLTDLYPADATGLAGDGRFLLRAAQQLLEGWDPKTLPEGHQRRLHNEIAWFGRKLSEGKAPGSERRALDPDKVQPGVLTPYLGGVTATIHGCLLLFRLRDAAKLADARAWIGQLAAEIDWTGGGASALVNLCFTHDGLARIGVPADELAKLPTAFREGMEMRAPMLGDVRAAHPRNWTPPRRYAAGPAAAAPAVALTQVDMVLHLRVKNDHPDHRLTSRHPLQPTVERLARDANDAGVELLAIEPMRSATNAGTGRDHFGFVDGLSQPVVRHPAPAPSPRTRDDVAPGELLWGYGNDRGDGPQPLSAYFDDGSFLVVRKMAQDVDGYRRFLQRAAQRLPDVPREALLAKMMGRDRDGNPPIRPGGGEPNDFDYKNDADGGACPFQAHIRRANPRQEAHARPTPRIMRRGLSYGPATESESTEERGVVFMAFNASISEQFEVIQRWINGGNSTGVASCQGDPFMAVGREGDLRTFQFRHDGAVQRIDVLAPLVALRWGLYLFAPSRDGLAKIAAGSHAAGSGAPGRADRVTRGVLLVDELKALAAVNPGQAATRWKALLEDYASKDPAREGTAAAIHAAVTAKHCGMLAIPYPDEDRGPAQAVLVTTRELARKVLGDPAFSMRGQRARMDLSLGPIYLGLDDGDLYRAQSEPMNGVLSAIGQEDAFVLARSIAQGWLETAFALAGADTVKIDLKLDYIPGVLAGVCRQWFGIPDCPSPEDEHASCEVEAGGWDWRPLAKRRPRCPGDFLAPSRYCFYPDPLSRMVEFGQAHAGALVAAVKRRLQACRASGAAPPGSITGEVAAHYTDDLAFAQTIVGVMTGFLPPAEGSLRAILHGWLNEGALWRVQSELFATPGADYTRAETALLQPLKQAMQKRPVPDMLFRTAERDGAGDLPIEAGQKAIIAVAGITAADLAAGTTDVYPIFGGDRRADPHPTHACPAYRAAMGVMLGMVGALLDAGRIEKLPASLLVKVTR